MSFIKRAQEAAAQAAEAARVKAQEASGQAARHGRHGGTAGTAGTGVAAARARRSPRTCSSSACRAPAPAHARRSGVAKRGMSTVIEKIDPGTLAELVIKATALQEMTNKSLRQKGSPYRIAEISISASIPPAVSFAIQRLEDEPEDLGADGRVLERARRADRRERRPRPRARRDDRRSQRRRRAARSRRRARGDAAERHLDRRELAPGVNPFAISASTSSIGRVERSPVARSVTSTPPAASERGDTVRIQGMPSSSASVNLTPGDSSRSSHRISCRGPASCASVCSRSAISVTRGSLAAADRHEVGGVGRDLGRPDDALVVVVRLDDAGDVPPDPDAVRAHDDGVRLAVLAEVGRAGGVGELRAELEDVPDLDPVAQDDGLAADRAGVALLGVRDVRRHVRGVVPTRR